MCFLQFISSKDYLVCSILLTMFLWLIYFVLTKSVRDSKDSSSESLHRLVMNAQLGYIKMFQQKSEQVAVYRLLLKNPKMVNILCLDGYSPFMKACLAGKTQLVKMMLSFGADVSLKSFKGETPFYLAVYCLIKNPTSVDASCIHALYYAGSDIDEPNSKGYAPIHLAAAFGHTQLVVWLMNKGACAFLPPDPYDLARFQGHEKTAKAILNGRLAILNDVPESTSRSCRRKINYLINN